METLIGCAIGAIICAGWVYLQFKIFDWAAEKDTLLARIVSKVSLLGLSLAITLVGFTAFGTIYMMFIRAAFGS